MSFQPKGMYAEVRREEMARIVRDRKVISVDELSEHFSVSQATVRSDLTFLEKEGVIKRTHGGATLANAFFFGEELTSKEKETQCIAQKQSIARAALAFVHPGDTIGLDTGTTTMELAQNLTEIPNLTVVTNDLKIAALLEESSCNVILLGGTVRPRFHCTIGNTLKIALQELYLDTLFLGTNGLSLRRGFSTPSLEMAEAKKTLMASAGKKIMLADSSKAQKEGFATFSAIDEIDTLITDTAMDPNFVHSIRDEGVQVILAE